MIRVVRELYGLKSLREFGPNDLRAVQAKMVELKWSRGFINRQIVRLRHMFKWAVDREMVGDEALNRLKYVESLLAGRSKAKEGRTREPVTPEQFDAVTVPGIGVFNHPADFQGVNPGVPGGFVFTSTCHVERSRLSQLLSE